MDISAYIESFTRKKKYYDLPCDAKTVHNLFKSDSPSALINQVDYYESDCLAENIKLSVQSYLRDKDIAIGIYKSFIEYLRQNGVNISVEFPQISISNTFERLMFISKYLQNPNHKISDLSDVLWVSSRTISDDIKKLRGLDTDPIQICGKVFKIEDAERGRDVLRFQSTAHPLFLTPNLTQILVMLKGLKAIGADSLYSEYSKYIAMDIWEQLSDYAKERIHFVLSELMPEDLSWYESLIKEDDEYFYSEYRCSVSGNVFLDCIKNGKTFCVEYLNEKEIQLYKDCKFVPNSFTGDGFEVDTNKGRIQMNFENIIKSAYTVEELAIN